MCFEQLQDNAVLLDSENTRASIYRHVSSADIRLTHLFVTAPPNTFTVCLVALA